MGKNYEIYQQQKKKKKIELTLVAPLWSFMTVLILSDIDFSNLKQYSLLK